VIGSVGAGSESAAVADCATVRRHRALQQAVTAEMDCEVASATVASCSGVAVGAGEIVSVQVARNGQDFVQLASTVRAF
jgi:hypothetical protein